MELLEKQMDPPDETAWQFIDMVSACFKVEDLPDTIQLILATLNNITDSPTACLFINDPRNCGTDFFYSGLEAAGIDKARDACAHAFSDFSSGAGDHPTVDVFFPSSGTETGLSLIPLISDHGCLGLLGLPEHYTLVEKLPGSWERLPGLLANLLDNQLEKAEARKQLTHLNSYLTVSSTLTQSLDLHELLELSMYCCMEAVPVEAASILLLDDEKKIFTFYEIEGSAKTILKSATFPADRGIAGAVLRSRAAEIINDVYDDPRFYQKVDSTTGFQTRNMIAIPLIAGEEEVGVLEFMNKLDGGHFKEEELLWLIPLADEMAFAVRNAILFEYVASTYCKQRQGLMSCKGCQRPLGSWTPCVKYRDVDVLSETPASGDTLILPRNPMEPT